MYTSRPDVQRKVRPKKKRLILVFKKEQLESGFIAELPGFKHKGVVDDWFLRLVVGIFIDK